jgi:hypothetical protein
MLAYLSADAKRQFRTYPPKIHYYADCWLLIHWLQSLPPQFSRGHNLVHSLLVHTSYSCRWWPFNLGGASEDHGMGTLLLIPGGSLGLSILGVYVSLRCYPVMAWQQSITWHNDQAAAFVNWNGHLQRRLLQPIPYRHLNDRNCVLKTSSRG